MHCCPEQKSKSGQAKSKDISLEDPRENEGGLDLLFFVVHLLVRNILRCFKTEKKISRGEQGKSLKEKGKKLKEGMFC